MPKKKAAPAKTKSKSKIPPNKPAKAKAAPKPKAKVASSPGWVAAAGGHELGIRDGKLVARKGDKQLGSVPKPIRAGEVGDRLAAAIDFLDDHARSCAHTVEMWMLRSLPVPRRVLEAVMADRWWAAALKEAWVVPVADDNTANRASGGFFRGVDPAKGIGVVDCDGETAWLAVATVLVPHPVLLDEVDDLRQMAVELGVSQGVSQLFREVFVRPEAPPPDPTAIATYAGGEFAQMSHATGLAKRLGYRVSGGAAVCRVLEGGKLVEARYDLGDGDPEYETTTGDLGWVDDKQRTLAVADVPPVAYSEGVRMAAAIYAKRKVDKEGDDE